MRIGIPIGAGGCMAFIAPSVDEMKPPGESDAPDRGIRAYIPWITVAMLPVPVWFTVDMLPLLD